MKYWRIDDHTEIVEIVTEDFLTITYKDSNSGEESSMPREKFEKNFELYSIDNQIEDPIQAVANPVSQINLSDKRKVQSVIELEKQNKQLVEKSEKLEKDKEKIETQQKMAKKENARFLSNGDSGLLEQIEMLNAEISRLNDERKISEEHIDRLQKQLDQLQEDSGVSKKKLKDKKKEIENKSEEIDKLIDCFEQEKKHLNDKLEEAEKEIDGLIVKIERLVNKIDQLEKEKHHIENQIDQLNIKISQLKRENDRLSNEIVALGESVDGLKNEIRRLKGKQILPIALSVLLGAVALAVVFRALLKTSNLDSELQRKLDKMQVECSRLASLNDILCEENRVLLATNDSLSRENDSLIMGNTQKTPSNHGMYKIDSCLKYVGLSLNLRGVRKENPERKFWIKVKRIVCIRSLILKCTQTGSAVIRVFRYKDGQSELISEQNIYLEKGNYSTVEIVNCYLNQVGLYYLMICNNNCGDFYFEKVVHEREFKRCFSDDIDILGLGGDNNPPPKRDSFTRDSTFDYGYFGKLYYCRIIEE